MATDVSICSNALLMLGAQSISSLAESSERAKLAANLYPQVRDRILRSHPWNCCIKRVSLNPDSTPPAFDWAYQFQLPGDFVKALGVGELGMEAEFRIEGRKLLMDESPLLLRYVFRNTDPATWDDELVNCVSLAMKAAMAYAITQSQAVAESARDEMRTALAGARAVDGQDDTPETLGDSPLYMSRFGSGGPGRW